MADLIGLASPAAYLRRTVIGPALDQGLAAASRNYVLRNGLLLWGPPGCGQTELARAIAGDLQTDFQRFEFEHIVGARPGAPEQAVREAFEGLREGRPAVVLIENIDLPEHLYARYGERWCRLAARELMRELEGANEGLFVIGTARGLWTIDPLFLQPGRLNRTLCILPPDGRARQELMDVALGVLSDAELRQAASLTEGLTRAELMRLCEAVLEAMFVAESQGEPEPSRCYEVLIEAIESGVVRSSVEWFRQAEMMACAAQDGDPWRPIVARIVGSGAI